MHSIFERLSPTNLLISSNARAKNNIYRVVVTHSFHGRMFSFVVHCHEASRALRPSGAIIVVSRRERVQRLASRKAR